jgi:hypothetical protein
MLDSDYCGAAPAMMVYDHACAAFRYAHNRDPKYWAGTAFRIDRLHIKNHTTCVGFAGMAVTAQA